MSKPGIRMLARHCGPSWPAPVRWPSGSAWWPWDADSRMLSESFRPYFEWCGNTWLGSTIRDTVWAFPVIETFHLLALAVLLGSVLIINLGVFGIGTRTSSDPAMVRELEPWMLTALAVLI